MTKLTRSLTLVTVLVLLAFALVGVASAQTPSQNMVARAATVLAQNLKAQGVTVIGKNAAVYEDGSFNVTVRVQGAVTLEQLRKAQRAAYKSFPVKVTDRVAWYTPHEHTFTLGGCLPDGTCKIEYKPSFIGFARAAYLTISSPKVLHGTYASKYNAGVALFGTNDCFGFEIYGREGAGLWYDSGSGCS